MNMYLNIFLCCQFIVVISANIVPGQTYSIYQQNGYQNPPVYEANNIQTYFPGNIDQNDIQPSPSSLKQTLLSKLFTNPSSQTSFDPSIINYCTYLNGIENYQKPVNLVYSTDVINLKNDTNKVEENFTDDKPTDGNKKRKRKHKSKKKKKDSDEYITSVDVGETKNNKKVTENTTKKSKQIIGEDHVDDISKDNTRKQKKKKKQQNDEHVSDIEHNKENPTERKRRKKHRKDNEKTPIEINSEIQPKQSKTKDNLDVLLLNEGSANENRQTRNSESKDVKKDVSNSPEDTTKQFLNNLQQYNPPDMVNWFDNYKNFYELMLSNRPVTVSNKKRLKKKKKVKKNKKTKKRKSTKTKNVLKTSTVVNTNTDNETTTTEKIIYLSEQTETDFNSDLTENTAKVLDDDEIDITHSKNEIFNEESNIDEFDDKYDIGYYEGYIDDYYPKFYDSDAYIENNKDILLENNNENKYYYATDRVHDKKKIDETKPKNSNYKYSDDITEKAVSSGDNNIKKSSRSPLLLEAPNFWTRKIDKSEIIPNEYSYKNDKSNEIMDDKYSKTKTPIADKHKENEMQVKDIETVFAKSKVVSYGPVYKPEGSSRETNDKSGKDNSFKGNSYKDDGITYIIAESLDSPEWYW